METRPAKGILKIVGNVGVDKNFRIEKTLSLADHELVVGERYTAKNIPLSLYTNLGLYVSGVNLVGVRISFRFVTIKVINNFSLKFQTGRSRRMCTIKTNKKAKSS